MAKLTLDKVKEIRSIIEDKSTTELCWVLDAITTELQGRDENGERDHV